MIWNNSAEVKQVHGEPSISNRRLLAILLPLTILLAGLLLSICTLIQLPLTLLTRCFWYDLRDWVELRLDDVDRHVNIIRRILIQWLHCLNLILCFRSIRSSLQLPAIDALVEFLLMRLHDLLDLWYYLYLGFLILSDDLSKALGIVLLGSIGQSQF